MKKSDIKKALEKHWNIKPAAKELGVGYSTLRKWIKIHGIKHNSRLGRDGKRFDRKEWQRKYNVGRVAEARRNRKRLALDYLGGMKCTRCGFNESIPDCYAFHHKDPKKKDPSWGKMKTHNWAFEKWKPELDKCIVLCHNCHSIVHYLERQSEIKSVR